MKIKALKRDEKDRPILITEQTWFWFWKVKREFLAQDHYVSKYYQWVELPNKTIVGDRLSFQLDSWLQEATSLGDMPKRQ